MDIRSLLSVMRADAIPEQEMGRWSVRRTQFTKPHKHPRKRAIIPAGTYTRLMCSTLEKLHTVDGGECVMVDTPEELLTHVEFVLRARGRILVTGLGLGCVVRGLLTRDRVTLIDVIERQPEVLAMVAPHMPKDPRLAIHEGDAAEWLSTHTGRTWDYCWHDLWSDPDRDDPHLTVMHSILMRDIEVSNRCRGWQGAWAFPRYQRRLWDEGQQRRRQRETRRTQRLEVG